MRIIYTLFSPLFPPACAPALAYTLSGLEVTLRRRAAALSNSGGSGVEAPTEPAGTPLCAGDAITKHARRDQRRVGRTLVAQQEPRVQPG